MSLQPPSFLFGLAGGVIAGALGAVLLTSGRAGKLDRIAGADGELAQALEPLVVEPLVVELRELIGMLLEREPSPLARPAPPESLRVPVESVTPTHLDSHELLATLRELTMVLKRVGSHTGEGAEGSQLVLPPREDATWAELPVCRSDEERKNLQRDHLLWGYQKVLDRYGYPDSVQATQHGGLRWNYKGGQSGESIYVFSFEHGMVAGTYVRDG